jgi:hypothetical protein
MPLSLRTIEGIAFVLEVGFHTTGSPISRQRTTHPKFVYLQGRALHLNLEVKWNWYAVHLYWVRFNLRSSLSSNKRTKAELDPNKLV